MGRILPAGGEGVEPLADARGHGSLHVRVAWHRYVLQGLGMCVGNSRELLAERVHLPQLVQGVQSDHSQGLIISGASGVDLLSDLTIFLGDVLFNGGMAIFLASVHRELACFPEFQNLLEGLNQRLTLRLREDTDLGQHAGVGRGGFDVVGQHELRVYSVVLSDRVGLHEGVQPRSAPQLGHLLLGCCSSTTALCNRTLSASRIASARTKKNNGCTHTHTRSISLFRSALLQNFALLHGRSRFALRSCTFACVCIVLCSLAEGE
mmetsp:Transcript_41826/g.63219  ORF Transcript_41826/g.63219 Transcript_41826/m.63219 type:complete len:264 (+) Transcript_41826:1070-1861(+)